MANLLGAIGQARPVSDFIEMAGKYQQNQSSLETQRMEQQQMKLKLDEEQKKQAHLDEVVDFRFTPMYLSLPDSAKPAAEKAFKSMGAFDENYRGSRRKMYLASDEISKSKEMSKAFLEPVVAAKGEAVVKAFEKMRKNPEDPKAKAEYETTRMDYEASSGKLLEHLNSLEKPVFGKPGEVPYYGGVPGAPVPGGGKLGEPAGMDGAGKTVYKSDKGLVYDDFTPYTEGKQLKPTTESKESISDFAVFYRGEKEKNPNATDAQISQAWHDMKVKEAKSIGEARIPAYTAAPAGLPPGYVFNRRTGNYEWRGDGPAPGADLANTATDYSANKKSLDTQVKIRDSMQSYVKNMKEQVNRLKSIKGEITRLDTRLLNIPIRKWGMSVRGSAAEAKVNMYLTEISSEIGKLATGSTASVQELSQSAREKWEKIHDPNMSLPDMINLLEETQKAGDIRMESVDDVIRDIKKRIGGGTGGGSTGGGGGKDPLGLGL